MGVNCKLHGAFELTHVRRPARRSMRRGLVNRRSMPLDPYTASSRTLNSMSTARTVGGALVWKQLGHLGDAAVRSAAGLPGKVPGLMVREVFYYSA